LRLTLHQKTNTADEDIHGSCTVVSRVFIQQRNRIQTWDTSRSCDQEAKKSIQGSARLACPHVRSGSEADSKISDYEIINLQVTV
jgi:hypothetical protein